MKSWIVRAYTSKASFRWWNKPDAESVESLIKLLMVNGLRAANERGHGFTFYPPHAIQKIKVIPPTDRRCKSHEGSQT